MKKTIIIIVSIIAVIAITVGGYLLIKGTMPKEKKLQTAEEMQNMLNTIYSNEKINLPELETTTIDVNDTIYYLYGVAIK